MQRSATRDTAMRGLRRRLLGVACGVAASLGAAWIAGPARAADEISIAPAPSDVALELWFDGAEVAITGAFSPPPTAVAPQLAVFLIGEPRDLTMRKKGQRWGMWLNTEQQSINGAPIYHAVAVSDADAASAPSLAPLQLSTLLEATPDEFRTALLRLRGDNGLYSAPTDTATIDDGRFQAHFELPDSAKAGSYTAHAVMLDQGRTLAAASASFALAKGGWERAIERTSIQSPLLYGVLTLIAAALAGLLAHMVFGWLKFLSDSWRFTNGEEEAEQNGGGKAD